MAALLFAAACGPSTGSLTSGDRETGEGDERPDIGGSAGAESSSDDEVFCGGEALTEFSWCHTAVDFDVSPMVVSRIFGHVAAGPSGAHALILHGVDGPQNPEVFFPQIYQEFVLTTDDPGFRLRGFGVEASIGSTEQLIPVRVFSDAIARHDYLPPRLQGSCVETLSLPSPEREAEFRAMGPGTGGGATRYGFDRCTASRFSPIALAGTVVDSFFYYCGSDEYCLSIDTDPPADGWFPSRLRMPAIQVLPGTTCPDLHRAPDAITVGRFDASGSESVILLRAPCANEVVTSLQTVVDAGGGRVAWGADLPLGALAGRVRTLRVLDLDQDGFDDLLLLGADSLGIMRGTDGGLTEPRPFPLLPFVLPYFDVDAPWGEPTDRLPPNVRVGAGQLDSTPELELVIRVEEGVRVVSLDGERSVLLDELASDFTIADVDADGIDDLAMIYEKGERVRIYQSTR